MCKNFGVIRTCHVRKIYSILCVAAFILLCFNPLLSNAFEVLAF